MKREWVVFFHGDKELFRYTLKGEGECERESTIKLLAYENGLDESDISFMIVLR